MSCPRLSQQNATKSAVRTILQGKKKLKNKEFAPPHSVFTEALQRAPGDFISNSVSTKGGKCLLEMENVTCFDSVNYQKMASEKAKRGVFYLSRGLISSGPSKKQNKERGGSRQPP